MYKITLIHKSAIALLVIMLGVFFYCLPSYAQDTLQIIGLTNKAALVNEELNFKIEVDSPNRSNLSYYYKDSLPKGAKFNRADGTFYWKPSGKQLGIHKVTLGAAYGVQKEEKTIEINVINKKEILISDKEIGLHSLNISQDKVVWVEYKENKVPVVYKYDFSSEGPAVEFGPGDNPVLFKDKILYVKDNFIYDDAQKKICGPISISGELARHENKLAWFDENKAYYYDTAWFIKSKPKELNLEGMRVSKLNINNEKIALIGADTKAGDKDIENIYLYNTTKLSQPEKITSNNSSNIHFGSVALYKDKIIWTQDSGDSGIMDIYIYDISTRKKEKFALNVLEDINVSEDYLIWQSVSGKSPEEINYLHIYDFNNQREVVLSLEPGVFFNPKAVASKDRIIYASECKLNCPRNSAPYKLALVNLYFKPQIANIEPKFGVVHNSEIIINGYNFGEERGSVLIDSLNTQIKDWANTKVRCVVPVASKTGDVEVKVVGLSGESQPKGIYIYREWTEGKASTKYSKAQSFKAIGLMGAEEGKDTTPPVSSDNIAQAEYSTDLTVRITANDSESGIRGIGYKYWLSSLEEPDFLWHANELNEFPSFSTEFTLNEDGEYTVKYFTVNRASKPEVTPHEKHIKINKAALLVSGAINIAALNGDTERTNSTLVNLNISGNNISQMRFSNTLDFNSAQWKPYSPTESNWTLISGDGDKTVYAQFKNDLGNTAEASDTIIYDSTAPDTAFKINNDASSTSSRFARLNMSGEAASLMRFSNSGDFSNPDSPVWEPYNIVRENWELASGVDGTRTVYAQFKDQAGNPSIPISDTIIYDSTGPTAASLTINEGNPYTKDINVKLGILGTEITQMRFSNTNNFSNPDSPVWESYAATKDNWPLASGADGLRTVYAQLKDSLDNTSIVSGVITLDTTPPTVNKFKINEDGTTIVSDPEVNLNYDISDAGSGISDMQFSETGTFGNNWITCIGSDTARGSGRYSWRLTSADGPVTVTAHFRDAVNNVSTKSDTINLRTAAPTTTFTLDFDRWHNKADLYAAFGFIVQDNSGAGIEKILYSTNGLDPDTEPTYFDATHTSSTVTFNREGIYTVKYRAIDKARHSEEIKTADKLVKIDKTPPVTTPDYDGADAVFKPAGFTVNLTAVELLSGLKEIRYTLTKDGAAAVARTSATSPAAVRFDEAGVYTLSFYSLDNALNQEAPKNITVKISSGGPVARSSSVDVNEDESKTFNLDVSGMNTPYYIAIKDQPQHAKDFRWPGASSLATIYQPQDNYNGADYFTFFAFDDNGNSADARVDINVVAANDLPVLGQIGNKTGKVGEPLAFTLSAQDIDNDALRYSAEYEFIPGQPLAPISELGASINSSTGEFRWTPAAAQVYTDLPVTFTVNDGKGGRDSETVKFNITTVRPSGTVTLQKSSGNALQELNIEINLSGSALGITEWTAFLKKRGSDETIVLKKESVSPSRKTIQKSWLQQGLNLEYNNTYYCFVHILDANGYGDFISSNEISLNNSPPNLNNIPNELIKDEGQRIEAGDLESASDPEGQSLTYTYSNWFTTALPYTVGYDTATVRDTPVYKTIHVRATDSLGVSAEKDVLVIVNNVVKPPEFNPSSIVLDKLEGDSLDYTLPLPRFYGTPLSVVLRGSLPSGLLRQTAVDSRDHIVGTIAQGTAGRYVAEWVVEDTEGASTFTVTINVIRKNHAPVAQKLRIVMGYDDRKEIILQADDQDGDRLTYSVVDGADSQLGSCTLSSVTDGNKIYFKYNGPVYLDYGIWKRFYYKANDGKVDSNIAAVDIRIAPADTQPPETEVPQVTMTAQSIPCHTIWTGVTDSIQINWTAWTGGNVLGYNLQRQWQPNDQWPYDVRCSDDNWCPSVNTPRINKNLSYIDNYVSPGRSYCYRVKVLKPDYTEVVVGEICGARLSARDACKGEEWTSFGNKAKSKAETAQTKSLVAQFMPGPEKSGLSFAPKTGLTEQVISSVVKPAEVKAEKPAIIQFMPVAQPQKTALNQEKEVILKPGGPSFVAAYNDSGNLKEISVIDKKITHNYAVTQDNRKPIVTLSRDDKSKAYLHLDENRQKVENIKVKAAKGVSEDKLQEEAKSVASFMGYELAVSDKKQK